MERAEPPNDVGPLDDATLAPMRTLITSKLVAMLVLAVAAVVAGVLLAPQVGTGMGWASRVAATVTAIDPLPASDTASDARCARETVRVTWGAGHAGSYVTCAAGAGADAATDAGAAGSASGPAVGDVITVRAVAGWQTVVIGGWGPNAVLVAMLLAVLGIGVGGAVRYVRQRRALGSLRSRVWDADDSEGIEAERVSLAMAFDALSLGRGRRAMLQLRFADRGLRPIRVQIPGTHPDAMRWREVTVYPAGRTRAGGRTGPYVLRTRNGGLLLASGGAIRAAAGSPSGRGRPGRP